MTAVVTAVRVERCGAVLALGGDLNAAARDAGEGLIGFELAGHLAAAAIAAYCGQPGGFLRQTRKRHGTGNRLDGAVARDAVRWAICEAGREEACRLALASEGLHDVRVVAVECVAGTPPFGTLVAGRDTTARNPASLKEAVRELRGDFSLSSGARSATYWETLPAAHEPGVAAAVALRVAHGTLPIGVGHGGTYLGAAAALHHQTRPMVIDPAASGSPPVLTGEVTLLDDFVTTGGAFAQAAGALTDTAASRVRRLAAYALRRRQAALEGIEIMHLLP